MEIWNRKEREDKDGRVFVECTDKLHQKEKIFYFLEAASYVLVLRDEWDWMLFLLGTVTWHRKCEGVVYLYDIMVCTITYLQEELCCHAHDIRHVSFVIFICHSQNIQRHSAIGGD